MCGIHKTIPGAILRNRFCVNVIQMESTCVDLQLEFLSAGLQGEGEEAGWPTKKKIWWTKNGVFLCVSWFPFVNQKTHKKKKYHLEAEKTYVFTVFAHLQIESFCVALK